MSDTRYLQGLKDGLFKSSELIGGLMKQVHDIEPDEMKDILFTSIQAMNALMRDINTEIKNQEVN